ncbi:MAG: efflux RND transporter periplasmic adaptor subunit [Candidatus Hydrogenedentes bacterium]|nr:efflux RND transporter periplasmic adaptor subunit [Candidatus Hydrogenedentota bacterium]
MTNPNLDNQLSKLRIANERKRPRRRRGIATWTIAVLAFAGGAFGIHAMRNAPIPVTTARIQQEDTATGKGPALVTASGYITPRHKVEVSSMIVGRVQELRIKRGDRVKAGDVLLRIDDADYQARVKSAQAQVVTLRARLAELRAGSRPQEIAAAKANVASSEATLRNAELDVDRLKNLRRRGAVSQQELDRATTTCDVARAKLDSDRKAAELVAIGPRKEQIDAAEAQLHEAEGNLELAQTELAYTVICAPISGTILEKLAEQGELVTNTNFGGTRGAKSSVVTMADLSDLQVEIDLNETELSKIKLRQQSEIRLDSRPGKVYSGEVDDISPQADRQKGTVQVKVRVVDPDDSITTEVNARVTFLGDASTASNSKGQSRLWIPKTALVQNDKDSIVYILADGKAKAKAVRLGIDAAQGMEVIQGLDGSETLIVSPTDKLKDGVRVVATP